MNDHLDPQEIQNKQYYFPYHHLMNYNNDKIDIVKIFNYGFEEFALIKVIENIILQKKPKTIIDIGCGDGKLIYELLKNNILDNFTEKIIGIDINSRALSFAKIFNDNNKARFFKMDITQIYEEKFDFAILMEVIEHIPTENIRDFIKKVSKVIKKNKFLIVTVPSKNIPIQPKHYRHYDTQSLKKEITPFFKIEEIFYLASRKFFYNFFKYIYIIMDFFNFSKMKKLMFSIYKKKYFITSKEDCIHIVFLCKSF